MPESRIGIGADIVWVHLRYQMNPPVTGGFPSQRPVTRNFAVFVDLRLKKKSWANNGDARDLRCHHAHYDVTVVTWHERHCVIRIDTAITRLSTLPTLSCGLELDTVDVLYKMVQYNTMLLTALRWVRKKTWSRIWTHKWYPISHIITLKPRQNGRHFPDDIFKCIFLNENVWISIQIPVKFVPHGPINNMQALFQIMAWRRPGDKPLSETIMVTLLTHICVTGPQWVIVVDASCEYLRENGSCYIMGSCCTESSKAIIRNASRALPQLEKIHVMRLQLQGMWNSHDMV